MDDKLKAIAYLILNDALKGGYWPDALIEWAQGLMRDEKRVGIEIVRAATGIDGD